ncbi:MAG: hypothetical protein GF400_05790 [Candidatus Eisenbacteria bacterium]|nr:hypothetical protein [Candidatus Eisenbacteria bacterium]
MSTVLAGVAALVAAGVVALLVPVVRARLSSMRTGVAILAVVALLSLLGVLIGQGLPPEAYFDRFGPALGMLIIRSGLASVFTTWYFLLAVWALSLSVLSCSFRRILRLTRARGHGGNRLAAAGSLVTHLSLIAVVAGGVASGALGFRRVDDDFLGAGDTTEVPEGGFALEVLEARTEFTEDGKLSDYVSVVNVLKNGRKSGPHRIEVNHPLTVNGVGVFQYEMLPSPRSIESALLGVIVEESGLEPTPGRGVPAAGEPFELRAPFGQETAVPGTALTVKAVEFLSDFSYDIESGTAGLRSMWHDNPAVLVQVAGPETPLLERWLFVGLRAHEPDGELPVRLVFLDYEPDFRNGLTRFEYSRQPGTPLIFAGLGALSVGMCVVFWVRMRKREDD